MSTFLLPKWVLKRIDQIRRKFLWHGHRDRQSQIRGLYMVSWTMATRPRQIGGLGVRDLQITNQALLMKWMWQWLHQRNSWWTQVTPLSSLSDKPWHATNATAFWKNMESIVPAFNSSVLYKVGNGNSISFWYDNWRGTPLIFQYPNLYRLSQHKQASLAQYAQNTHWLSEYILSNPAAQSEKEELLDSLHQLSITHQQDEITWLRHSNSFSVKSAYNFLSLTPSPDCTIRHIWQIRAPLRVMVFAWLLLNNRLTTIDNLTRRGWQLPNMCMMCKQGEENIQHLFQQCSLVKQVRSYIQTAFGHRYLISNKYNTASSTQIMTDLTESMQSKQWEISTCFVIWRERCRRIFADKQLDLLSLVREICLEKKAWFDDQTS